MPYGLAVDNWAGTLATQHLRGDGQLALTGLNGLPALPANRVYRVTAVFQSDATHESILGVFEATGLNVNILTGVTASSGYTDTDLAAGTTLEIRVCRATIEELQTSLDLTAPLTSNKTITAQEFVASGSSANYTVTRNDTHVNVWQIGSNSGELYFWNVIAGITAVSIDGSTNQVELAKNVQVDGKLLVGNSTSDYSIQIAWMGLQWYSVNNCWISDNLYFNNGWKYKANGYASLINFTTNGFGFFTAPDNMAGSDYPATLINVCNIDRAGNITAGNNITAQKLISNGGATDYSIAMGTMGIQAFGTNNCWIMDNVYYDGTGFKYKANGYATQFGFYGGSLAIYMSPNNSAGAGAGATQKQVLIIDINGNLTVAGNITGQQLISNTGVLLPTLSDVAALNGSIYLGSNHLDTASAPKLCRKDGAGNVTVIG